MKRPVLALLLLAAALPPLAGCGGEEASVPAPRIVAQGFRIADVQAGELQGFGDLEVRVEAPARIQTLTVRERSYDVDLARSPETGHYPLFGLSRRVHARADVTLNFKNYVNAKIAEAGRYRFEIAVTDAQDRSASATLVVEVRERPPGGAEETAASAARGAEAPAAPLRGEFRFERVGAAPVTGADPFGLTWRTVEPRRVVIRLRAAEGRAPRFARLRRSDYDAIRTREELDRIVDAGALVASLELPAANGAAAGEVFAVVAAGSRYVFRASRSETSLSELGTTVTLAGQYKH